MTAPKITHVFRLEGSGPPDWVWLTEGRVSFGGTGHRDVRLALSGQRVPAGVDLDAMKPGDWFEPEDIPAPVVLDDIWINVFPDGRNGGIWSHRVGADDYAQDRIAVLHVSGTVDEPKVAVERVG